MTLRRSCALFVLALSLAAPAGAQSAPPLVAVRVASNAADDVTPILYAQKTGMFAKAGSTSSWRR